MQLLKWLLFYFQDVGGGDLKVAESLAKLQLTKFVTGVEMLSDSSLSVRIGLGSCELDATRPSRHTGITRYFAVIRSHSLTQTYLLAANCKFIIRVNTHLENLKIWTSQRISDRPEKNLGKRFFCFHHLQVICMPTFKFLSLLLVESNSMFWLEVLFPKSPGRINESLPGLLKKSGVLESGHPASWRLDVSISGRLHMCSGKDIVMAAGLQL